MIDQNEESPPALASASDERVVAAMAQGGEDALTELIRRYASRIGATILRIGGSSTAAADIEEAVADTFLVVWGRASTYDPTRGPVLGWLVHLATYRGLEIRRRAGRRARDRVIEARELGSSQLNDASLEADVSARLELAERIPDLERSLSQLSSSDLYLLRQRFVDERAPADIARELGISANAVRIRLSRALGRLRRGLLSAAAADPAGDEARADAQ